MKRCLTFISLLIWTVTTVAAQNVTVRAVNKPAASVFRSIVEQTGKNFVYPAELLNDMRVTVEATDRPLDEVLGQMFARTGIEYKVKGNNIILKRRATPVKLPAVPAGKPIATRPASGLPTVMLDEVTVVSRLESPAVETAEIGARKVTADEIRNTPALFGEADVIKALHSQPGVTGGTEGMAGMHVHGGNADENMYMLDNVPLYHVNHFGGLFSAFNTDIIRYIDFFKSSMPAKYDGRLSSFMDVRLQDGNRDGHHGTARLGLTSGALNISGPIGRKTTYLVGVRRSWFDLLTIPVVAIINSSQEDRVRFHYSFIDLNAKVSHRLTDNATAFASVYFGNDMLKTGLKDEGFDDDSYSFAENDKFDFHWGNLVVQTGLNYRFKPSLSAEFTAAYTRYFSDMKYHDTFKTSVASGVSVTDDWMKTNNNINDWIFRGDFTWRSHTGSTVRFGAGYIHHSFLPARTSRSTVIDGTQITARDSTWAYGANEVNAYIEDDMKIGNRFRINAGLHASVFAIDKEFKYGISPRLSMSYRVTDDIAVKGAYSHTTQYVHQLSQSYLSLPTDQWIPVTGGFKPQTADKIAAGIYWQSASGTFAASAEGYYKWMNNLVDYTDEYYLKPPLEMWNARLTRGSGTARGIDLKIEKRNGHLTGHIAYSLAWADRQFAEKNGGRVFPARFDNRHSVNILLNWNISDRVSLNALWTGHSGNRFTLLSQMWMVPGFDNSSYIMSGEAPLRAPINNYRLPFYHRLDLSCTVRNSRGHWTFSLYNAYNHLNVIGIKRGYRDTVIANENGSSITSRPVFQKIKFLPVIPSISYTWQF